MSRALNTIVAVAALGWQCAIGSVIQPAFAETDPIVEPFILVGISYLNNGRPFGQTDFGLRVPRTFCERQKVATEAGWVRQGAEARRNELYYFQDRQYAMRLFCVEESRFDSLFYRSRVSKTKSVSFMP